MEWKAKLTVFLKMKVPESVNIFKYISKHQDKQINEKEMEDMTDELIIERKLLDNFSMALHELLLRNTSRALLLHHPLRRVSDSRSDLPISLLHGDVLGGGPVSTEARVFLAVPAAHRPGH